MDKEMLYSQTRHMLMIILGNCLKKGHDYNIDKMMILLRETRYLKIKRPYKIKKLNFKKLWKTTKFGQKDNQTRKLLAFQRKLVLSNNTRTICR